MEQEFCSGPTAGRMLSARYVPTVGTQVPCKGAPELQLLELPRLRSINDDFHGLQVCLFSIQQHHSHPH